MGYFDCTSALTKLNIMYATDVGVAFIKCTPYQAHVL